MRGRATILSISLLLLSVGWAALAGAGPSGPIHLGGVRLISPLPGDGDLTSETGFRVSAAAGDRVRFFVDGMHLGDMEPAGGGEFAYTLPTHAFDDGYHAITVTASGGWGEASDGRMYRFDNSPPEIAAVEVLYDGGGAAVKEPGGFVLRARVSDAVSGVRSVAADLSGVGGGSVAMAPAGGGWYSVRIAATEVNSSCRCPVTIGASDLVPETHGGPLRAESAAVASVFDSSENESVSLVSPAPGTAVSGTVELSSFYLGTVPAQSVSFHIGASMFQAAYDQVSGLWKARADTRALPDGGARLRAVALSVAGGYALSEHGIMVDNTAPSLRVASPWPGTPIRGRAEVRVNASDGLAGIDPARATLRVDDSGPVPLSPEGGDWVAAVDTAAFAGGAHLLEVSVADRASNLATLRLAVTADNTPPSLILLSPREGASVDGIVTFEVAASDNFEVARVEISLAGRPPEAMVPDAATGRWLARADAGSLGAPGSRVDVRVRAADTAGNDAFVVLEGDRGLLIGSPDGATPAPAAAGPEPGWLATFVLMVVVVLLFIVLAWREAGRRKYAAPPAAGAGGPHPRPETPEPIDRLALVRSTVLRYGLEYPEEEEGERA